MVRNKVKISIIMPLFNASKYLEECLQSVLGQTFTDFELICINDASDDSTERIVLDFQKKDGRIRLLSNACRCGAAFSRNRGMKEAEGKYLAFLDGDDIFDEEMLEKAYDKIEAKEADLAIFDFRHVPSENIHRKLRIPHGGGFIDRYCKDSFTVADCEPYELITWGSAPWNKLYRRAFVESNQLVFQDLPCANDSCFVNMALMLAGKLIVAESEKVMVYVRDHSDAGRISRDRDPMCTYKALMQLGKELIKRGKFGELGSCFFQRVYFSLMDALIADRKETRAESFYRFLQKEGIHRLCTLDQKAYAGTESYIRKELEQFLDKDFVSGWYREKNILSVCLAQNAGRVKKLFENWQKEGYKVAIWGAGENGVTLLKFCIEYELPIEAVIDQSSARQGKSLYGYSIFPAKDVKDRVEVIIVSARYIYDDVVQEAGSGGKVIMDINQFFCLY